MILLFVNAIRAIRQRSLGTLSSITVTAVVDRTLLECKERFPILESITSGTDGFHFDIFLEQIQLVTPEQVNEALEHLLSELLEVFGKITAEILTKYLHQELMTVTYENEEIESTVLSFPPGKKIKNEKKND